MVIPSSFSSLFTLLSQGLTNEVNGVVSMLKQHENVLYQLFSFARFGERIPNVTRW